MTQDLFYYESGYVDENYFVYTADAESLEAGSFSLTAAVGVIKAAESSMSVSFSQTATISHIEGVDMFAMSNAALAADVARIRDNNTAITSAFTQVTAGAKFMYVSSEQSCDFAIEVNNLRVRTIEAAANAAFSLACVAEKIEGGFVRDADAALVSESSLSATADRTRLTSATLTSAFDYWMLDDLIRGFDAALTSTSALSAPGERIIQGASTENAAFTPSITCDVTKNSFAVLDATLTLTAQALVNRVLAADLSIPVSLTADIDKLISVQASLTSQTAITTNASIRNKRPRQVQTQSSGVVISSTQSVLGGASLYVPYTGSATSVLRYYGSNDFYINADQDFNIEFFYYHTNRDATTEKNILSFYDGYNDTPFWSIGLSSGTTSRFRFEGNASKSGASPVTITSSVTPSTNQWYYIRVYRSGTTINFDYATKSGGTWSSISTIGTTSSASWFGWPSEQVNSQYLEFGDHSGGATGGYYDEVFVASGTSAREQFQTALTPNVITVGKEATTLALFHYNSDFSDDINGTAKAQAVLTSSASLAVTAIVAKVAQAAISSSSALDTDLTGTLTASASLQVNGFVMAATGRIRPEVAGLESAFALTVTPTIAKNVAANLSSTFVVAVSALDIDLAQASLSSAFTQVTVINKITKAQAALIATTGFNIDSDSIYLQLVYGAGNTSGYITSTGGQIKTSFTNRLTLGSTYPANGFQPVVANFWLKTAEELANGQELILYTSGLQSVVLSKTSDRYRIKTSDRETYAVNFSSTDATAWSRRTGTRTLTSLMPVDWNPTVWHNVHMTLSPGNWTSNAWPVILGGIEGNGSIYFNTYVDNQSITPTASWVQTNSTNISTYEAPTSSGTYGEQWGDSTNFMDIWLDQIWITNQTYNASLTPNVWVQPPSTEFASADINQTSISRTGLTTGGYQAQVFLYFQSLNDTATDSPTWNYTKHNQVKFGFVEYGAANLNSAFALHINSTRLALAASALTSSTALVANNRRIRYSSASMSTTSTLTASVTKIARISKQLTASTQQTTTAIANRYAYSTMLTSSQLLAVPSNRNRLMSASLTTAVTTSANATKIAQASSQQEAFVTELTAAAKTGQGLVHSQITASMVVNAVITADQPQYLHAVSTMTATGYNTQYGQASLALTAEMTAFADKIKETPLALSASTSLVCNLTAIRRTGSTESANFYQQTATYNSRIARTTADLEVNSTQVTDNQIVRLAAADLTTSTGLTCIAGVSVRFEAHLDAFITQLALSDLIHIDPYYQIKIKAESRELKVQEETRVISIKSETRVNKIKGLTQ